MAHAGLWGWAVAALALFIAVFAAWTWRVFSARERDSMARGALLPFDDGTVSPASAANAAAAESKD